MGSKEITTAEYSEVVARLDFNDKAGETVTIRREWPRAIPVSERLPENKHFVLAFHIVDCEGEPGGVWDCLWFNGGHFIDAYAADGDEPYEVTHWLPMPPTPAASATAPQQQAQHE